MARIVSELFRFWQEKELEWGRDVSVSEVAKATGLNWETVANLKKGETTRFDSDVIGAICEFFGAADGEPVPFLVVRTH